MENRAAVTQARSHTPRLVLSQYAHRLVHGAGAVGRFNMRVALMITRSVGSMWCAYVFALLALISLPAALQSRNPIVIIGWIAQTFLQLVLLPVIIVGQNVQAAASDARAESDHETLLAIHTLAVDVHRIDEHQSQILALLAQKSNIDPANAGSGAYGTGNP